MAVTSNTIAELLVLHWRWTAMVDVSVIITLHNNHTVVSCHPLKKNKSFHPLWFWIKYLQQFSHFVNQARGAVVDLCPKSKSRILSYTMTSSFLVVLGSICCQCLTSQSLKRKWFLTLDPCRWSNRFNITRPEGKFWKTVSFITQSTIIISAAGNR